MSGSEGYVLRYVFGPCRDGIHGECLWKLSDRECSCDCGHTAQREREVRA